MMPMKIRAFALGLVLSMAGMSAVGAQEQTFEAFLADLRTEAQSKGISDATLDAVLVGLEPLERVIRADRNQPEFKQTFWDYQGKRVTAGRIDQGRAMMRTHRSLLNSTAETYGVPARFIVSFWGMESNYGRFTGKIPIIQALATLAWDPRRSRFFRAQLLDALTIVDEGYIPAAQLQGSWAGAMGHMQFIPSSYLSFAVDADGDGDRDIWGSYPDIFASAANYLKQNGWNPDRTWGRQVRLPPGFDVALAGKESGQRLPAWQDAGIRRLDGSDLPTVDIPADLLLPDEGKPETAFLIYENFEVILRWNRSDNYAIAVGRLADALRGF